MCCVKPFICLLLRLALTAAAWPVRVLLLFDGVGRTSRDISVRAWVDGLVLLEGGAASKRVWNRVFLAEASGSTASRTEMRRRRRRVDRLLRNDGGDAICACGVSTLGTPPAGTLGTRCVCCVINLVWRRLSLILS